jgi:hypothetical protein
MIANFCGPVIEGLELQHRLPLQQELPTMKRHDDAFDSMHLRASCTGWFLLAFASLLAGCVGTESRRGRAREEREHEKESTGRDFRRETRLESHPSPSLLDTGFDAERAWSGFDDWEPWVAVDPNGRYVYQLTTRYSPVPRIAFRRSSDDGATFDLDGLLPASGEPQNDPQALVANDGTLFVVWLDSTETLLIKSSDRGETWSEPVRVWTPPPNGSDHGWLALSPDGRDVYVGFNKLESFVSASHDFGASFGPAIRTNPPDGRSWFHTGAAVAPDGAVYIAVADFSLDYTGPANVGVLTSRDGGASWTTTIVDTVPEPPDCANVPGCEFGFFGSVTGLALDSAGTILLVYPAGPTERRPQAVYARSSADGIVWGERVLVSAPSSSSHNAFPAVAAGPLPGDFRVVWQGSRRLGAAFQTYYRRSDDGGASWRPIVQLSDRADGAPYKTAKGYRFPYGDYLGLTVGPDGTAHAIWGEGLSYEGPGGTWFTRGR